MAGHLHHGSSTRDAVRAPTLADCAFECVRATAASAFECATFSYSLVAAESDAANCALSALPAGDIIINQGRTDARLLPQPKTDDKMLADRRRDRGRTLASWILLSSWHEKGDGERRRSREKWPLEADLLAGEWERGKSDPALMVTATRRGKEQKRGLDLLCQSVSLT